MAVSLPNSFPTEIWVRIGSISSLVALLRLSETCNQFFHAFRRFILENAESEQRRMGMPFFITPFTFTSVRLTVQQVVRNWRILPPQQCRIIRTRLMDQPLELYVNLSPLTALLDALGTPIVVNRVTYDTRLPSASNSREERISGLEIRERLILLEIHKNINFPSEIALEIARSSFRVNYLQCELLTQIIRRKDDSSEKASELIRQIESQNKRENESWSKRVAARMANSEYISLTALISVIRGISDAHFRDRILETISEKRKIPLKELQEMLRKELPKKAAQQ